jgi:hypothetical protein
MTMEKKAGAEKRKVETSLIYFIFILQAPLQILQEPLLILKTFAKVA